MKKIDWHSRSRAERLASVMFPTLTTEATRQEMQSLSNNERKRSPQQAASPLLADATRGACSPLGGAAKGKAR